MARPTIPLSSEDREYLEGMLSGAVTFPIAVCVKCGEPIESREVALRWVSGNSSGTLMGHRAAICLNDCCRQITATAPGANWEERELSLNGRPVVFVIGQHYNMVERPIEFSPEQRGKMLAALAK